MRRTAIQQVVELAKADGRVCFIGSDLGYGVMDDMRAAMPERLLREGISEQHIVGMAGGMALEGKIVYVSTIAPFLTKRCYEQIALDLCLTKAKVRLLSSGGGLVYAPLGPTHLAPDDFAILRPLPNMTILAPCDAEEMRRLMPLTLDVDGPVYVRFAKGGDKVVSRADLPCAIGKAVPLAQGDDVLFITTGITAQIALDAAAALREGGLGAGVLHCHTVKPLDEAAILESAGRAPLIVTLEEHVGTGGLGAAVASLLMQADMPTRPRFRQMALPDAFFSEHGSQADIMKAHGLTADNAARVVMAARS